MAPKTSGVLVLPLSVVSRADATRLAREVESIGRIREQAERRGEKSEMAKFSRTLEDVTTENELDLSKSPDRERLYHFLIELKADAPVIHMSFAAEPSSQFTGKLVTWLRSEIHPLALLDVGLQPSIAAGCIIRTTNKYFDCSMRQHLVRNHDTLSKMLHNSQVSHV